MRIVTYNIQFGLGHDGRIDLARTARTIARADIICLQEVDRHWRRSGVQDQALILSGLMPDRYWVYGAGLDVDASEMIVGRLVNRRRQFGNMTLSRWPILSSRCHVLPKVESGSEFNMLTPALETVIDAPGGGRSGW
ncbi:MAG: endonuclease/exonuclease/phosphatase family protein [Gemmobacter sp.]|jgi:endonuclease/exonuclease/phosphatase family metal-dependent hydrolase|nr:endonuclease/exonuclease/phosphatase family protein [Gemmobacter sp.]